MLHSFTSLLCIHCNIYLFHLMMTKAGQNNHLWTIFHHKDINCYCFVWWLSIHFSSVIQVFWSDATLLSDVLKDQCTTAKCHKVTSHKTGFFSNINVRISNLADFLSFIEHIFYFKLTIYWPSVITEHLNAILFTAVKKLYKLLDFMEHLHSTHFISPWHFVLFICLILSHLHVHLSIA